MSNTESPGRKAVHRISSAAILLGAIFLAGCGATPEPHIGYASDSQVSSLGQDDFTTKIDPSYKLRPTDRISVTVLREPDLTLEDVMIGADGTISLPLTGPVDAVGFSTAELADKLQIALRQAGLKRPIVSVNIVGYGSHTVTVEGGVQESGVYAFQPGARLSSAIALAKGPSRVSKLNEVVIFRQTQEGTAIALFDFQAIRQGTMIDPVIEPGDRVVVGISSLSQFWQDFIRALPAFGLFTNI